MKSLNKYTTFIKFEHTLFSLPLLFSGALLATGSWPSLRVSYLIVMAGASARVLALVLNRIIDRDIDRQNPRTQERHLSSGRMSLLEAWNLFFLFLLIYLLSAWLISDFCLRWSWVPVAGFSIYPFFKRFTKWAHVGLGMVWSMVPAAGFFAVNPTLSGFTPVFLLGLFSLFWLAGFDIIYATMDTEFDRSAGLYSLPACWGVPKAMRMSAVFHLLSFLLLVVLYSVYFSGPITVMLLGMIGVLLFMEQKLSNYVDLAFFQINAVIGFVVLFFVVSGLKGV